MMSPDDADELTLYVCGHCGQAFTDTNPNTGCPDCHDGHDTAQELLVMTGPWSAAVEWAIGECGECGPPFPRHRGCCHTVPNPATLARLKVWGLVA